MRPPFWLPLLTLLLGCTLPLPPGEEEGGISGMVRLESGAPATGATVFAYRNPSSGLRGPADFATTVDEKGNYLLDLVPGSYHLVARLRPDGGDAGPPRSGDAWETYPRNPVEVPRKGSARADFRLRSRSTGYLTIPQHPAGPTGIRGRAVDAKGVPLANVQPLIYRNDLSKRMPDLRGASTGGDGNFIIYVPTGGEYCLVLRTGMRGQPRAGELFTSHHDADGSCATVEPLQIRDLGDLVLTPYHP